jgi:hypothetical protein
MRRSISRTLLAVVAAAATTWACGGTTPNNPFNPTPPPPETLTFPGTLTPGGAQAFGFPANYSGTVTATLTSLGPDSTLAVGLALGTWSGSACTLVVTNDSITQGGVVTATSSSAGSLCVRISDAGGTLTQALPFVITVVHP